MFPFKHFHQKIVFRKKKRGCFSFFPQKLHALHKDGAQALPRKELDKHCLEWCMQSCSLCKRQSEGPSYPQAYDFCLFIFCHKNSLNFSFFYSSRPPLRKQNRLEFGISSKMIKNVQKGNPWVLPT